MGHDKNSLDPLVRPTFGPMNRIRRLSWQLTYLVAFRYTPTIMHGWRCLVLRTFGARLGRRNFIYPSAQIWAPWLLETGDVVTIARGVEVYNPGGVFLGHHTILSQDAYLCGATHDYNSFTFEFVSRRIETKPYVWICAKAIVLPGVTCGTGSVLAAGAVTSKDLDDWTVYAGNPARSVAQRAQFDVDALMLE